MNNAYINFSKEVEHIKNFGCIYDQIILEYPLLKKELDDMLRAQVVNIVSAMDCYIHEVVKVGIINTYLGKRTITSKCKNIPITLGNIFDIISIENEYKRGTPDYEVNIISCLDVLLKQMFKSMSFQSVEKIKDALSYIWNEDHKMQSIVNSIDYDLKGDSKQKKIEYLEQKLKLIVTRRNQIVHEADWDYVNNCKYIITKEEVDDIILFVEKFVGTIHNKLLS